MRGLLIFSLAILWSFSSFAQSSHDASRPAIDFMIGTWEGDAWKMMPTGKEVTTMKETVQCKIGCDVLVVDGLGIRINGATGKEEVVHEAFGVITYDKASGSWMMKAYTKYGSVESVVKFLGEKTIQWNMTLPDKSIIYYTADYSKENTWHETGEMSRDGGATKFQVMEMTLTKK